MKKPLEIIVFLTIFQEVFYTIQLLSLDFKLMINLG